jgi:hypothetical protein
MTERPKFESTHRIPHILLLDADGNVTFSLPSEA